MFRDQEHLIEAIYAALPYSEQIRNLRIVSERDAVRFHWRGTDWRATVSGEVEEIDGGLLVGSNQAMLMRALFARYRADGMNKEDRPHGNLRVAVTQAAGEIEAKANAIDDQNSVGTRGECMKPAYQEAARIVRKALGQ